MSGGGGDFWVCYQCLHFFIQNEESNIATQVQWTATTASPSRLLNLEKATFHTLAPILPFIPRYLSTFISYYKIITSSTVKDQQLTWLTNVVFQMAPYPGEHFDPAGLPPAGPHPVFPPQCGRCQLDMLGLQFDWTLLALRCRGGRRLRASIAGLLGRRERSLPTLDLIKVFPPWLIDWCAVVSCIKHLPMFDLLSLCLLLTQSLK